VFGRYEHSHPHDQTVRPSTQKIVADSLAILAGQGTLLYYTHQNIAEFWKAMTRPVDRSGLGLSVNEVQREVEAIEAILRHSR
jgi:hypothetical protein